MQRGIRVEPAEPRWGEPLTVTVETSTSGAPFGKPLVLIVFERRTEGFVTRRIPMIAKGQDGDAWEAHLTVPYLAFEIGFAVATPGWRQPGELTVDIMNERGYAPGTFAWQMAREPHRLDDLKEAEAKLASRNPFARVMEWSARLATGRLDEEQVRDEALELAADSEGLSPWGRRAIAFGLALSGDLDYAARAVEELARRYAGSPAVDQALRDFTVARRRAGIQGPDSLDSLRERLARKDPGRPLAREHLARWARTSGSLSMVERVARHWIGAEPNNPLPRHSLAIALHTAERDANVADTEARAALDCALAGWLWVYLDSPTAGAVLVKQLAIRETRIHTALAADAAADALAHANEAIHSLSGDGDDAQDAHVKVFEGLATRAWEQLGRTSR